jgi:hypothetical protein
MARGFDGVEYVDGEIRGLVFLAGERGMGKTTEMLRLEEQCTGPVVFFDTVGTHAARLCSKGFKLFSQAGPFKKYLMANLGRRVRSVFVPIDENPELHAESVCKTVRAFGFESKMRFGSAGGAVLLMDEIDMVCGPEWGHRWMSPSLYYLAQCGRHVQVSMACTARDPKTLPKKFRSQFASMYLFRVSEEDDVKYFRARVGAANALKLPTLQPMYYLKWQAGGTDAPVCGGPRKL